MSDCGVEGVVEATSSLRRGLNAYSRWHRRRRLRNMLVEQETGAYKVIVAIGINGMLLGYDTLKVYDSRTKSWSFKNLIPEGYCEPWVTYNSTFFDGSVYFSFTKDGYMSSYTVEGLEWSMTAQNIFPTYTKPICFNSAICFTGSALLLSWQRRTV